VGLVTANADVAAAGGGIVAAIRRAGTHDRIPRAGQRRNIEVGTPIAQQADGGRVGPEHGARAFHDGLKDAVQLQERGDLRAQAVGIWTCP
jgi:hypothetical protein